MIYLLMERRWKMAINVTWHLILVVVISIILIVNAFKSEQGLSFNGIFSILILAIIWAVYGGIFIW